VPTSFGPLIFKRGKRGKRRKRNRKTKTKKTKGKTKARGPQESTK
jgi:hypothetical protein